MIGINYKSNPNIRSGWAHAVLPHFESLQDSEICKDNAKYNEEMPNLMAMSTYIVSSRVVALWTPDSTYKYLTVKTYNPEQYEIVSRT
jgi:hypothetical protein